MRLEHDRNTRERDPNPFYQQPTIVCRNFLKELNTKTNDLIDKYRDLI